MKNVIEKLKSTYAEGGEEVTTLKVKSDLVEKYNDLISLRNRLQYEIEDEQIFEEDITALDYILDFLEFCFEESMTAEELKKIKEIQKSNIIKNTKIQKQVTEFKKSCTNI